MIYALIIVKEWVEVMVMVLDVHLLDHDDDGEVVSDGVRTCFALDTYS